MFCQGLVTIAVMHMVVTLPPASRPCSLPRTPPPLLALACRPPSRPPHSPAHASLLELLPHPPTAHHRYRQHPVGRAVCRRQPPDARRHAPHDRRRPALPARGDRQQRVSARATGNTVRRWVCG